VIALEADGLIVALGEQGSLLHAATMIHVTQPTATKMPAELEQLLGTLLYERERTSRGLVITPAGREVLIFARKLGVDYERLQAALYAKRRDPRRSCVLLPACHVRGGAPRNAVGPA
jgi:DNA-binding transcriptional LysR family regulator